MASFTLGQEEGAEFVLGGQDDPRVNNGCTDLALAHTLKFWRDRFESALRLRRDLLGWNAADGGCRLIYSESDGLSGLTVDRFGRWLVVQFTSLAMFERRALVVGLLAELTGADGIWLRNDRAAPCGT